MASPVLPVPQPAKGLTSHRRSRLEAFLCIADYGVMEDRLEAVLKAKRSGCSPSAAAKRGRLTPVELDYIIRLGAAGHPAYENWYEEYLHAEGEAEERLDARLVEKALDEGSLTYIAAAKRVLAGGPVEEEKGSSGPAAAAQSVVNLNIKTKFTEEEMIEPGYWERVNGSTGE